jgi:hypothetical protein
MYGEWRNDVLQSIADNRYTQLRRSSPIAH